MGKRSSTIYRKRWRAFFIVGLLALLAGCAQTSSSFPFFKRSERVEGSTEAGKQRRSRDSASSQLTDEGRALLENGRPDDAITMLERSVGIDPTNGESYYYLAEAWLLKDNLPQAEEFNRLAELYLQNDFFWRGRVAEQRKRITDVKRMLRE